jgi:hypothetical protein
VPLFVPLLAKKHFVLERQAKNQFRIENTEETLCGKKPDEGPRNGQILIFKSCASAISPHRHQWETLAVQGPK